MNILILLTYFIVALSLLKIVFLVFTTIKTDLNLIKQKHQKQPSFKSIKNQSISIIVRCSNNDKNIIACLDSLSSTFHKTTEIIVLAPSSKDNQYKNARYYKRKNQDKNIKITTYPSKASIKQCVSDLLPKTRSKITLFINQSILINPDNINQVFGRLENNSAQIITIKSEPEYNNKVFDVVYCLYWRLAMYFQAIFVNHSVVSLSSSNFFINKPKKFTSNKSKPVSSQYNLWVSEAFKNVIHNRTITTKFIASNKLILPWSLRFWAYSIIWIISDILSIWAILHIFGTIQGFIILQFIFGFYLLVFGFILISHSKTTIDNKLAEFLILPIAYCLQLIYSFCYLIYIVKYKFNISLFRRFEYRVFLVRLSQRLLVRAR